MSNQWIRAQDGTLLQASKICAIEQAFDEGFSVIVDCGDNLDRTLAEGLTEAESAWLMQRLPIMLEADVFDVGACLSTVKGDAA